MELLDYLKWRNDVSLSVSSFNDVDNVILSYISYIDFGKLFPESGKIYSIEEIFEAYCEKYSLDEVKENGQFTARAPLLLEQMVKGERFKGTRHDAMTWEVMRDKFVESELDAMSDFINSSLGTWLEQTDDETRESIVSTAFAMIEETEVETFKEFGSSLLKNSGTIIKGFVKLPKEKRDELTKALGRLLQSGGEAVMDKMPMVSGKE